MKGTFKIRNKDGECLCALFTEDYVFFNALMNKQTKELFKDFVDCGFITISDLNNFDVVPEDSYSKYFHFFVDEFYLISLKDAFSCKDFREFLFKCKELPDGCKEENGNG